MPRLRECDRFVVCGPCEVRHPASLLRCPECHSPAEPNNTGLCHLGAKPEPVEIIRTNGDDS